VKTCLCDFPAGISEKCKHIAALVYYINNEEALSKTDLPQQWGNPSKAGEDKYKKGKKISDLFPSKKNIQFQEPLINHSTFVDQYEILAIPCGLSKLIKIEIRSEADRECKKCLEYIVTKLEHEETETKKNVIVNNIFQNQLQKENNICNICFPLNKNEHTFFFSKVKVTNDVMKKIFNATIDQSKSVAWMKERSIRISATKAHKIKTCKCISDENLVKLANTMLEMGAW